MYFVAQTTEKITQTPFPTNRIWDPWKTVMRGGSQEIAKMTRRQGTHQNYISNGFKSQSVNIFLIIFEKLSIM